MAQATLGRRKRASERTLNEKEKENDDKFFCPFVRSRISFVKRWMKREMSGSTFLTHHRHHRAPVGIALCGCVCTIFASSDL